MQNATKLYPFRCYVASVSLSPDVCVCMSMGVCVGGRGGRALCCSCSIPGSKGTAECVSAQYSLGLHELIIFPAATSLVLSCYPYRRAVFRTSAAARVP